MKKKEEKQETSFRALLPFCYIKTIMSVPTIIIIIITIVFVFVLLFIGPMVIWFLKIFQKSIIRAFSLFLDLFLKLGLFNLIKLCSSILTKFAHKNPARKPITFSDGRKYSPFFFLRNQIALTAF